MFQIHTHPPPRPAGLLESPQQSPAKAVPSETPPKALRPNAPPGAPLQMDDVAQIPPGPEGQPVTAPLTSVAQTRKRVQMIVERSFPHLKGVPIVVEPFEGGDVFFQSNLKIKTLLNPWAETTYRIQVNPVVFEKGLPLDAADAILAHELAHTQSYVDQGFWGLLLGALSQILPFLEKKIEHETDHAAIDRGYGPGLIAYRRWQENHIGPARRERVRDVYLTPETIKEHLGH